MVNYWLVNEEAQNKLEKFGIAEKIKKANTSGLLCHVYEEELIKEISSLFLSSFFSELPKIDVYNHFHLLNKFYENEEKEKWMRYSDDDFRFSIPANLQIKSPS